MMKKGLTSLFLLLCLLSVACHHSDTAGNGDEEVYFTGKIVQLTEGTLLLASAEPSDETICLLDLAGLALQDDQGKTLTADSLRSGMIVTVKYDGWMETIYPARLSGATKLTVQAEGDDLVGLYLTVLEALYQVDSGLNSDITQLAFDLEDVHNLSAAEKQALLYLAWQQFQLETYPATFEDLQESGKIPEGELYFADGLLITFADEPLKNNRFTFSAQKWRSGLGAYFFDDCTASKRNGAWQYTIGAEAIS